MAKADRLLVNMSARGQKGQEWQKRRLRSEGDRDLSHVAGGELRNRNWSEIKFCIGLSLVLMLLVGKRV